MRVVNTYEYVTVLKNLVEEGHEVNMLIAGSSMSPLLIHNRDYIYFSKPDSELKVGDMVFYLRDSGRYVMHRIYKVHKPAAAGGSCTYDIIGDNQTEVEKGIRRDQIFARITAIKRKGKMIKPGDFWWEFFEKVFIRVVPFRRLIVKAYSPVAALKNICKK